jgi:hypothetical protein
LHRTFGGKISFSENAKIDARTVATMNPVNLAELRITTDCRIAPTVDAWRAGLESADAATGRFDDAARRTRGRVADAVGEKLDLRRTAFVRGGISQRVVRMGASALCDRRRDARGVPREVQRSIFTVAPKFVNGAPWNEDFRNWGGDYWWQNTRLPYTV